MAIRERYELEVNGRVVLRLKPKQDKVVLDRPNKYGGWTDPETLDREHLLELRDVCDEILMSWFCPDKPKTLCPICEREYGGIVPIVFDPADVGRLDMGEPLAGREKGQVIHGGKDTGTAYVEDTIEELRRQT